MAARPVMDRLLPLVREFGGLEKKRGREGVTPLEYQRWLDLRSTLAKHIPDTGGPDGTDRRKHVRVSTRLLAEFRSRDQLRDAIVTNISQGGLFLNTPFAPEIGTVFTLCIRVNETGEAVDVPCEVVSNNVDQYLATARLGAGVKFMRLNDEQQAAVDALFDAALEGVAENE